MRPSKEERRVFLGMPGYGKQTQFAGRALWRACADMDKVEVRYQAGSLLASNFNQLWCEALNLIHVDAKRVDYFAMLHDDVGAEDGWLDTLIDELEAKDLDVLAAAVPIKDSRGLTSMALAKPDDKWNPLCRLSMHDIYELPETFTSDDIGHPLLLNTGCWVCRFDMRWANKVHFEIRDRNVFNPVLNRYQAQTQPEDWHFSRQLHEIGQGPTAGQEPLRIGATRKVQVIHQGDVIVGNMYPWGASTFDIEATKKSPVPGAFPYEITGWLTPDEGRALAKLATGKRVLEIGSYCGRSTVCLARTAKHVTAVDYFDGRDTPAPRDTFLEFTNNLDRYEVRDKVFICSPDEELSGPFDLAFIDGSHDAESVARDVERVSGLLAPNGLIVFHDYQEKNHPGVTQAVERLVSDGGSIVSTHESLAVVKPPAAIPLEV